MQAVADFHPQKVFCCPCLLRVLDQIFDSGFRSLHKISTYLQELEDFLFEKIYCICIKKKNKFDGDM